MLATGGVYIGGGVPLHALSGLEHGPLVAAFRRKGRLTEMMARIPVHIAVHRAALVGAATCGLMRLKERETGVAAGNRALRLSGH